MRLGNTGGKNLGKKYLKIKGDEPITQENQQKADAFNQWFEREYFALKRRIVSQDTICDDEVLHETYLRIISKILYGGLEIKDYALYFHRLYFTNKIQLAIKESKFVEFDLEQVQQIDESKENIEIMKKQEETIQNIKAFVLSHYPKDYDLFVANMIDGITYPNLSEQTGIKEHIIQDKICTIKKVLKKEFVGIPLPTRNRHTGKTTSITVKQEKQYTSPIEVAPSTIVSLSDFSASDLMKELYARGYTGTLSFTQTIDISKVDIKTA